MEDIKLIIAQNIAVLRKKHDLTQAELAEQLNYSDKAVSKWERAESTPDITVLKTIADLFGVSVDYMIRAEHSPDEEPSGESRDEIIEYIRRRRKVVTVMSVLVVWVVATLLFVILDLALKETLAHWLCFAYALPTGTLVWLIMNSIWGNRRLNYLIISVMMWTLLFAVHISTLCAGANAWQMYLLGIPGQTVTCLWSVIGRAKRKK